VNHSFGLFKPDVLIALGMLAVDTGKRPSSLVSWNDEEEWMGRLFFDLEVMAKYHDAEVKAQKKAMKRKGG